MDESAAKLSWGKTDRNIAAIWPKDASGFSEQGAFLTHMEDSGGIADMTVAMLGAYGIPVLKQYSNDSIAGRVILGFSGYGVDLYVPASRLEEARDLLQSSADEEENDNNTMEE